MRNFRRVPLSERVDLDEARQLREEGWGWQRLANKYGVSAMGIKRNLDEDFRRKHNEMNRLYMKKNRKGFRERFNEWQREYQMERYYADSEFRERWLKSIEKHHKNLRLQRRKKSLCTKCGGEIRRTGVMCATCLKRAREYHQRFREKRIQQGLCPQCGEKKVREGYFCKPCLEKRRETHMLHREEKNLKKRVLFRERREQGLCPRCGNERDGKQVWCLSCREKHRQWRLKKKIRVPEEE